MNKLQKILFAGIIIFLPSQFGLHLWPEWAYINGVRIDYFSPTLYFTDCLIILLFCLEIVKNHGIKIEKSRKNLVLLLLLALFVLLNIYFSLSPAVTVLKWLKVAELVFLAWYVYKNKLEIRNLKLLIIPVIYSCILAVWQYFNHGSIGGLWYFLGERSFTFDTLGIAPWRPYATFSHPNVLAGFLVVSTMLVLTKLTHNSRKITALVLVVVLGVVLLTLSRGDWLMGWNLRMQLNNLAIQQFSLSPLIGTGLGTSPLYPRNITNFAMLHQPIHNIFLLLLSETGIFGLLGFIYILKKRFSLLLLPILFLGFFDHYWLTLQQTQLLLAIILGWLPYQKKLL